MLTDFEQAWLDLEAFVSSKPHHGSRDLALAMQEIRARNAVPEGLPEQALRLYGVQLSVDLRAAARDYPPEPRHGSSVPEMAVERGHRQPHDQEVDHDGSQHPEAAAR